MPTRDAVKTMLLRRFGKLWTMVDALSFDFHDHYVSKNFDIYDGLDAFDEIYEEEHRIMSEAFSLFARFVRNVLMLHRRSTIDSFYLDIAEYKRYLVDQWLIDDVQVWLEFAIDREVKDLHFKCDNLDDIAPPHCVLTSQSLVTLRLGGCVLVQYEHQPQLHMGNLRELSLCGVRGSNEAFNQLVSACPSLQKLEISHAQGLEELDIGSPVEVDWT